MPEPVPRNDPDIEEAYARAPERMVCEILNGVLLMSPRLRNVHSNVASMLGGLLIPPFRLGRGGPGGSILLDEPELHLGPRPDKMGPDLAGWRRERVPVLPDASQINTPPDWVCEVLSPSTEVTDRGIKVPIYAREGVRHVWLLDPATRTLELFALAHGELRPSGKYQGDTTARVPPFDAVELELRLLWET